MKHFYRKYFVFLWKKIAPKNYIFIFFLFQFISSSAQNLSDQPFAIYPMGVNPAFAGTARCDYGCASRFMANHFRPIAQNGIVFPHTLISWDQMFPWLYRSAFGITMQDWRSDYFKGNAISGIFSEVLAFGRNVHLRFAAQGNWNHSNFSPEEFMKNPFRHPEIDVSKLSTLRNQKFNLWNVNTGLLLYGKSFTVGLSLGNMFKRDTLLWHHLSPGFSRFVSLQGSYSVSLRRHRRDFGYLTPILSLTRSSAAGRFDFGALYRSQKLSCGLFYRLNSDHSGNAITAIIGYRVAWVLNIYYFGDIKLNSATKTTYTHHGITAILKLCVPPGPRPLRVPQGAEFGGSYHYSTEQISF